MEKAYTFNNGVSVIIPFLNEEEGIGLFCKTFDEYVGTLSFDVECIFVDDGSTDLTADIIRQFPFAYIKKVLIISLSKNFGSHAAIRAGLTRASYDICTWLGSDLQEPLDLIPLSYKKITEEGYDAVYIEKNTVEVSKANRFFSKKYSKLMRKYAVNNYSTGGTSTIVFNGKIKEFINENIEGNSSIMLQIMDAGYSYCQLSMDYNERAVGTSKWTLPKKIKLLIDSFVSFSFMPIRLVSIVGVVLFFLGVIIGIITVLNWIWNPAVPIGYSTLASVMALGFGITNISLGIIAEYLWRTYDAARNRPVFNIAEEKKVKGYDE